MIHKTDHRGFALPAAIGALVIVGVLVTAGFYMAQQELRIGVASSHAALAVNMAQSGANDVLVNRTDALTALSIWGDTTLVDTLDQGVVSVEVTKLATRLYFLNSTAQVTEGGARWAGATRSVGLVTRMTSANMEPPAALTTQGSITVGGSSIVNGYDSIPSAWGAAGCDSASLGNKPGLMIDDADSLKTSGNKFIVAGTPKVLEDTTITVESLLSFGDMGWGDLVALAEKVFTNSGPYNTIRPDSSLVGGTYRCRESLLTNLGDPRSLKGVCSNYFPIIYATGNLKFTGGYGQGILLVEGNLDVQGGFEFFGPVFVKGTLTTQGTGGHFNGGVVAANVDLSTTTVLGNAVVSYSSCAVERAVLNNSALTKVRPLEMRSWVDLSSVINN